ncbi:MAG: flagellin [Alsobacter sp.]
MTITLTASSRQNLLALQDTAALQSLTQTHLATGKKVASALDNPVSYFTAQGLDNRANDLNNLLDGISNGIQTIQAANQGITSITKLVDQAKGLANQALATQLATSGTATSAFTAAAGNVDFYVNGTAATQVAITTSSTIDSVVTALNSSAATAAGLTSVNYFSKDSTGTKIVINANADVEFKDTTSVSNLGFTPGSATANKYGTNGIFSATDVTVSGVAERKSLADQYNSLLQQITQLANDANYNGVNLLNNSATSNKLHIQFNEKDTSNLDVAGVDVTSAGLSLASITSSNTTGTAVVGKGYWLLDGDIKTTAASLGTASSTLRAKASTFGSNLSVVQNRQDFSKNLINILQAGSGNLTNADLNEEAANSQALQTRQSLGISALSLANTAQQQVLQLLR